MNFIKKIIPNWLKRALKKRLGKTNSKKTFPGSKKYWENRYLAARNSGPGSYGRLALFKAEVLNRFVVDKNISSVLELGCGDGNQLSLAKYPPYLGFDVSKVAISLCRDRFKNDPTKKFYLMDNKECQNAKASLVLSLDVIYHLIEDTVFVGYMSDLFQRSTEYVIIYSSNYNDHFAPHVKCRKFTDWIEKNVSNNWKLVEVIENKYPFDEKDPDNTSMADFYIYEKQN